MVLFACKLIAAAGSRWQFFLFQPLLVPLDHGVFRTVTLGELWGSGHCSAQKVFSDDFWTGFQGHDRAYAVMDPEFPSPWRKSVPFTVNLEHSGESGDTPRTCSCLPPLLQSRLRGYFAGGLGTVRRHQPVPALPAAPGGTNGVGTAAARIPGMGIGDRITN